LTFSPVGLGVTLGCVIGRREQDRRPGQLTQECGTPSLRSCYASLCSGTSDSQLDPNTTIISVSRCRCFDHRRCSGQCCSSLTIVANKGLGAVRQSGFPSDSQQRRTACTSTSVSCWDDGGSLRPVHAARRSEILQGAPWQSAKRLSTTVRFAKDGAGTSTWDGPDDSNATPPVGRANGTERRQALSRPEGKRVFEAASPLPPQTRIGQTVFVRVDVGRGVHPSARLGLACGDEAEKGVRERTTTAYGCAAPLSRCEV
jgi:hypothetical protein